MFAYRTVADGRDKKGGDPGSSPMPFRRRAEEPPMPAIERGARDRRHARRFSGARRLDAKRRLVNYLVRIVLHEPPPEPNYDELHRTMDAEDFRRWVWSVVGSTSGKVELPPAEYAIETAESAGEVLVRAKRAAAEAHKGRYSVLVTPVAGEGWSFGLDPWVEDGPG